MGAVYMERISPYLPTDMDDVDMQIEAALNVSAEHLPRRAILNNTYVWLPF